MTSHINMKDSLFPPQLDDIEELSQLMQEQPSEAPIYEKVRETICGTTDDSQAVEQYDGTLGVTTGFVNAHQASVGQLQWNNNLASIYTNPGDVSGARWCSGTLIANDLFLTAGHCFDSEGGGWSRPLQNGTTNVIQPSEIATNMHVNFNYQVDPAGNPRPEQSFPITSLVEYRLGGLDFAIVRLGGNPGRTFGTTQISQVDAVLNSMACIIGHPAGFRKRVEAGPITRLQANSIGYNDIDTLGGNSGSGILSAADGRIVGVHTNGGCDTTMTGNNFGVRITSLIAQSPMLQALTRPTPERFNAIWLRSNEDRPAVWGWARADFDKRQAELQAQGYRLVDLNAFMLPNGQGERFNAIWQKSNEDRPAVWGWARADFDKRQAELQAQGYRLVDLNAFMLPNGQGERFNAIWRKSNEDRPAVWGWARADFDKRQAELQAQGYRLVNLNAFVLP
jgi:V8-like Glu-specific endopeptidase